jgi:hypothetical protein
MVVSGQHQKQAGVTEVAGGEGTVRIARFHHMDLPARSKHLRGGNRQLAQHGLGRAVVRMLREVMPQRLLPLRVMAALELVVDDRRQRRFGDICHRRRGLHGGGEDHGSVPGLARADLRAARDHRQGQQCRDQRRALVPAALRALRLCR